MLLSTPHHTRAHTCTHVWRDSLTLPKSRRFKTKGEPRRQKPRVPAQAATQGSWFMLPRVQRGWVLGQTILSGSLPFEPSRCSREICREPSGGGIAAKTLFLAVSQMKHASNWVRDIGAGIRQPATSFLPLGFHSSAWRGRPVPSPRAPSHALWVSQGPRWRHGTAL